MASEAESSGLLACSRAGFVMIVIINAMMNQVVVKTMILNDMNTNELKIDRKSVV